MNTKIIDHILALPDPTDIDVQLVASNNYLEYYRVARNEGATIRDAMTWAGCMCDGDVRNARLSWNAPEQVYRRLTRKL